MSKIELPSKYSKWYHNFKKAPDRHKKFIGKPMISWSQIKSFKSKTGFNTGLLGKFEYFRSKFSKEKFEDMGWGFHGHSVETYITLRNEDKRKLSKKDKEYLKWANGHFSDEERKVLDKIKPLGTYQYPIMIDFDEFVLVGDIDDFTPPKNKTVELLRDYKTKSKSSKADLLKDEEMQLDIYGIALNREGYKVKNFEYCIIERTGGSECFKGGGKESLGIGDNVWYQPYDRITDERSQRVIKYIKDTVLEISAYYKVYKKYFA